MALSPMLRPVGSEGSETKGFTLLKRICALVAVLYIVINSYYTAIDFSLLLTVINTYSIIHCGPERDPEWCRGVTTDPGSIPGCITTGRDRESHRAAHIWPSVVRVRGGFGRCRPSL